jgi:GNAT superfamily N-acetyltransferase
MIWNFHRPSLLCEDMVDQHPGSAIARSPAPDYQITLARPKDVPLLPAIELAAGRLYAGHAPEEALTETMSAEAHADAQRLGHLWVALLNDAPVAFAHVRVIEATAAHLEELDVHPEHGRRGLGTRLVMTVCAWAAARGFQSVTLTTFRDIAWNMPFYARLGFEVIPPGELRPALVSLVEDEARRSRVSLIRVAMQRPCIG